MAVVAGDCNAQLGQLSTPELSLGGRFTPGSKRTDNGDRLLHLCSKHGLFLANTNFRHKKIPSATWRSPNPEHPWIQLDQIAISRNWRGCIQDCRSYWSTPLDSDHALVLARFVPKFSGSKTCKKPSLAVSKLSDPEIKTKFQSKLDEKLTQSTFTDLNAQWESLRDALYSSAEEICGRTAKELDPWISTNSLSLINKRRNIPAGKGYMEEWRKLDREIKRSLRQDRENWWLKEAEEMESVTASGNSTKLFQLIRQTGPRKAQVSEVIEEADGTLILNRKRRSDR